MVLALGETYVPANAEEIRDDILTDIRLAAIDAGVAEPPVHEGTDWFLIASAVAEVGLMQYANIRIAEDDTNVLTAVGDALRRISEGLGLPEVEPTKASGKVRVTVTTGAVTVNAGTVLVLPNGKLLDVVGTHVGITNGAEIDVEAQEAGEASNTPAGTAVRFSAPPVNVDTNATVSNTTPISNGSDEETDARRRTRVLNRLQNTPSGGNWADIREKALNASGALRDVFVYPALGGPSTQVVTPVKFFDRDNDDFSPVPTTAQINTVRDSLQTELADGTEVIVRKPVGGTLSPTLLVTVPDSSLAGGNGTGWLDQTVWPKLEVADSNVVTIGTVTSTTQIIVSAATTTAPVANQTHIMWWSTLTQKFTTRLITAVSGGTGVWDLTLSEPLVDSLGFGPFVGDFISPALENAAAYRETWLDIAETFGPAENTADANRLPRSLRHPLVSLEQPSGMTSTQLTKFQTAHPEITDIAWGVTLTLAVPGTVDTAANIFAPVSLGIYQK